jgi:FdrA protein
MKRVLVERNRYFDSVFLMRISRDLEELPGVLQATVAMGTPANLESLADAGFAIAESAAPIQPGDLVIAVEGETEEAIGTAEETLRQLLSGTESAATGTAAAPRPVSIDEALHIDPEANLAVISVPGDYAAREARQALRRGLHVMLFSDNVSVEDEIALKDEAVERGLLMMGPDCGTAIVNGAPLGFANVVRRGSIGIVGASGTGIQEISSLVHRSGGGISQAIGTGGRDLSADVEARMTRFGIELLARNPGTDVVVVVSKAPAPEIGNRVVEALRSTGMPCVVHFVAGEPRAAKGNISFAKTLAEAAEFACAAAGIQDPSLSRTVETLEPTGPHQPANGRLVGLFSGGTLAQEAWDILHRAGLDVRSNVAADPSCKAKASEKIDGHAIWDLGDDAFTVGRPHPMIEPSLRDGEVVRWGTDRSVGIILVDCVLGYGAHDDPAGSLAEAARAARATAESAGRELSIIASVTGTDADPQVRSRQVEALTAAGVHVAPSNAAAARWAAEALRGGPG